MDLLELALSRVQKPARYIGNELNSVHKTSADVRFAFCFPDVYEVGMSHLGIKILYHIINNVENLACERVYAPWPDMEEQMQNLNLPLFALESKTPVRDFDFVGFTLQYEMSYSNVLNMLDLAGIPLLSKDRDETVPIIVAGGPCAYNPEPLADFIDVFSIGEGEDALVEMMQLYDEYKKAGKTRAEFLHAIAKCEGFYVPALYDVSYNDDGTIAAYTPKFDDIPVQIKKRIMKDLDAAYYPEKMIVPFMEIVHDRVTLELFRGCIRGCRFCQAGMVYRPVRERSVPKLKHLAECLLKSTGYQELSMSSLSTSDYSDLKGLTDALIEVSQKTDTNLAIPSMRVDSFSLELMEKIQQLRKGSLTFAPEAGSQRMRNVINKNVTEEDLVRSVSMAFNGGYSAVKLYFMIGLPTENDDDIRGIADLSRLVVREYFKVPKEKRSPGLRVTASASAFVPKPFTPFQWQPQDSVDEFRRKQALLRSSLTDRQVTLNWHDAEVSSLEGVFARGDRKLGKVLLAAHQQGCKFDAWAEYFDYDRWMDVFKTCDIDPTFYNQRERTYDEVLPWDILDIGVTKAFLRNENERAKAGVTTKNCREQCAGCGMNKFSGGLCHD